MNWKKIGMIALLSTLATLPAYAGSSDGQPNGYEYGFEVSPRVYGKCGSSDSY